MEKIKFGIIGYGSMGSSHASRLYSGLIENGTLAAIADIDKSKVDKARVKFGENILFFDTAKALIISGCVDAVIVATPHYSHPEICMEALKEGLNVICEKPAGVYTKQVLEMNEAVSNSKGLFTVMFNQRTNCLYRKMRETVLGGGIGEVKRINWLITNWYRSQSYYDSSDWRATWSGEGGGVLVNQCPHQLDLLQWVTGMMPSKIRAFCHFGKWHNIEVEDDVTAYLEYENGATGAFITSTADCPGTNRFEILGTSGKMVCENDKLEYYKLSTDEREFNRTYTGGFGEPEVTKPSLETDGKNPQHAGIINNFANAVLGLEPLFVDGREGINSVRIMNAMLLSTWLDKTVELPFDDNLYYEELKKRIAISKPKNKGSVTLDVSGTYGGSK
ncbi:MAG: Gfo/Idh/MocA family oxidoreductase [Clostridia bacterium]|nr:Gfo/Idh/MocA family oxidoreductase [Clostridia bacterium]